MFGRHKVKVPVIDGLTRAVCQLVSFIEGLLEKRFMEMRKGERAVCLAGPIQIDCSSLDQDRALLRLNPSGWPERIQINASFIRVISPGDGTAWVPTGGGICLKLEPDCGTIVGFRYHEHPETGKPYLTTWNDKPKRLMTPDDLLMQIPAETPI